MISSRRLLPLLGLSALFAGCSIISPQHACPLSEQGGTCANMNQAYAASRGPGATKGNAESVLPLGKRETPSKSWFGLRPGAEPQAAVTDGTLGHGSANQETFRGFAQPQESGSPVYTPPRVHRAWSAPWTDADGRLHGGEYTYFTTPGGWNYGSLKSPGQAGAAMGSARGGSNMMGPVRPSQLGFTPKVVDKRGKPIDAPEEATTQMPAGQVAPAPARSAPADSRKNAAPATKAVGDVTQPYKRFGDE